MKRGSIFVVSGPAGVGKGTIVKRLREKGEGIGVSVSCTTRPYKREGEIEGVSYYFITEEKFAELIGQDAFFEYAGVHEKHYGTLNSEVERVLGNGEDLILEIDVQGFANVKAKNPDAIGVFICPPSMANLEKRLRDRKSESEADLQVRLNNARGEIAKAKDFDYVIVHEDWNDNPNALEKAVDEVYDIIKAKRCSAKSSIEFIDSLIK